MSSRPRNAKFALGLGALLVFVVAQTVKGDRVILRGGGQIQGVILPEDAKSDKVSVQTADSAVPVTFKKSQLIRVEKEASPLDEYLTRRDQVKPTAAAHYELGLWCEAKRLRGPSIVHYRRAAEIDGQYAPAQRKLGKVSHEGHWLSADELRQSQGMIKVKGKWVTPEEKERLDVSKALNAEQASWARRIKIYRQKLMSDRDQDRRSAELDLLAIREPIAVVPLVRTLGTDPDPIRMMLMRILGGIESADATFALVSYSLMDTSPALRQAALDEVVRRKDPKAIPLYMRVLKPENNPEIVGRAALVLAQLREVKAVPKLVDVLVAAFEHLEVVPTTVVDNNPMGNFSMFSGGPGGGNGISLGGFGTSSGSNIPYLTPPVTAPGAIAFGGGSIPISNLNGGMPGAGGNVKVVAQPQIVREVISNALVLEALQKLTNQNFGFDVPTWKGWLATSFRAESSPARKVQEPLLGPNKKTR